MILSQNLDEDKMRKMRDKQMLQCLISAEKDWVLLKYNLIYSAAYQCTHPLYTYLCVKLFDVKLLDVNYTVMNYCDLRHYIVLQEYASNPDVCINQA